MYNQSRKIAVLSMFTALALILSYVESLLPVFFGIPGIKLGLANLVTVLLLYSLSWKEAGLVSVIRILASGFLFGNLMSIAFALAGGIASLILMTLLKKNHGFSMLGVSIAGGCIHNMGQLLVAAFVVQTARLAYYLPVLLVSGLVTGFLIGLISRLVMNRLPQSLWNYKE